jgi:signal transduction histidine kinase
MNVVRANAELLEADVPPEKQGYLDAIYAKVEETATLSEKASTLEKITEASYERREFEITEAVSRVVEQFRREFPDRRIDCDLDDASLVRAHDAVEVALENLLENACKHSPADQPVDVRTDNGTEAVTVTVADSGPGIPENEIAVLDVGNETSLRHSNGIGLWIVRWIVKQSDGGLSFDVEDGTTVELTLPRATQS